jgi:two-component system sensor histidine kinase/response regulator
MTDLFAQTAADKNIVLPLLTSANVPNVLHGDPERIRKILINFVGSTVKFTEKGEVAIRASVAGESSTHVLLRFEMTDTGIGIPADRMDWLFQKFSQVDSSSTQKYGDTGLGLAISKKLADLMGGEVGAVSELDKGSTFWFTAQLEKSAGESAPIKSVRTHLHGLRALIVDDNPTNRTILQLTSWGIEVELADSGMRALDVLDIAWQEQRSFDIGALDWQMSEMDGLTLARAIRSRSEWNPIRLVLLTSVGQRDDGARAREAGIQAYLNKPVHQSQLFECLSLLASQPGQKPVVPPQPPITRHTLAELSNPVKILVAEDNTVNQKLTVHLLEHLGSRNDVINNGREALAALERYPYAVVLMDCQMPEMDGFGATAHIRTRDHEKKTHTPIIAVNQKLALRILSKMRYGVDVVGTGRKALEALAQRPYQLVLMDCQMPEMDRFEATAQIRANDNRLGTHTSIVALTAHAIIGDREHCLAAGMDDYLTKPIDREALRTMLEKWDCKPMSTTTNAASGNVSQEVPLVHQFDTPPHHFPLAHK